MSELIKREDAIKITWQEPQYYDPINALTEVREKIRALPTVDAVQVVRCKDCERWTNPIPIEMKEEGYGYCGVLWFHTHEDEYCAWGKRRLVE